MTTNKELAGKAQDLGARAQHRRTRRLDVRTAELLATPPAPPKRPIGFITPEDKSKKTTSRRA